MLEVHASQKDAHILTNNLDLAKGKEFILNAREYNEGLPEKVISWVIKNISKNHKIAISGLAFKGQPQTSDLRDSDSLKVVLKLHALGYQVLLHDFIASSEEIKSYEVGKYFSDFFNLIEEADHLLVLNNCNKYKSLNLKHVMQSFNENSKILDIWDVFETSIFLKDSKQVQTLGNMLIVEG